MNLFEKIQEEMNTDTESIESISEGLKDVYMCSTPNERLMIDRCFINLCGWSIKTLLENIDEEK